MIGDIESLSNVLFFKSNLPTNENPTSVVHYYWGFWVRILYLPEVVLGYTQAQQSILLAKTPWKRPYQLGLFYWPLEAARTRKPAVLSFLYYLHYYYYARLSSKESGCAMIHHQVLPPLMLSSYPSKKLVGHAMVLAFTFQAFDLMNSITTRRNAEI